MEMLLQVNQHFSPAICESGNRFLLHDNVTFNRTDVSIQEQNTTVVDHYSYLSSLAPVD